MSDPSQDYRAQAEVFRRRADEPGNEKHRAALLAIAEQYEVVAERLEAEDGP